MSTMALRCGFLNSAASSTGRPAAGGGLVSSCALLHEVMPVTRGRRFAVFTFLHYESHDTQYRRLIAEAKARGITGIRMRDPGGG